MPKPNSASNRAWWPDHQTVWRWHFYAGLICIPFVLWLSVTGSIYLFKPQIDRWLDRPYDRLTLNGPVASPSAQVQAALAAAPGSVLNAYEVPESVHSATRVLVGKEKQLLRVYVHPQTLQVLRIVDEDQRFTRLIFHLHGELMQGDRGSLIVETAASWAIVMLITGIYLWWPSGASSLAGVLYPRGSSRGRLFWRDLHAVIGLWISFFALFLLVSGLPWAKSWGGMLKEVRSWGSESMVAQDWTTGRASELAERVARNTQPRADEHAEHHAKALSGGVPPPVEASALRAASVRAMGTDYTPLNRLLPIVQAAHLSPPVLISPPSKASTTWVARSDTANRPRRVTLQLDATTGTLVSRQTFADRALLDRVIGIGVAAHEGQLFAPVNQVLGLFTAIGLQILSISAIVLWWRRRPVGSLGAPPASPRRYAPIPLIFFLVILSVLLPLLGVTLVGILCLERWVLSRIESVARFLGLADYRTHVASAGQADV